MRYIEFNVSDGRQVLVEADRAGDGLRHVLQAAEQQPDPDAAFEFGVDLLMRQLGLGLGFDVGRFRTTPTMRVQFVRGMVGYADAVMAEREHEPRRPEARHDRPGPRRRF